MAGIGCDRMPSTPRGDPPGGVLRTVLRTVPLWVKDGMPIG
jgi:hypothetical protein